MPYITDREPFRKEASLVISNTLPELPDGDLKLWRTPCCVVREHLHNHPMGQELETAFDQFVDAVNELHTFLGSLGFVINTEHFTNLHKINAVPDDLVTWKA